MMEIGCDQARTNVKSNRELNDEIQKIIDEDYTRCLEDEGVEEVKGEEYETKFDDLELQYILRDTLIPVQFCCCHIIDNCIKTFKMELVPIFIEPWGKLSQDSLLFKRIFKESFDEAVKRFMNLFKGWRCRLCKEIEIKVTNLDIVNYL